MGASAASPPSSSPWSPAPASRIGGLLSSSVKLSHFSSFYCTSRDGLCETDRFFLHTLTEGFFVATSDGWIT